MNIKELEGLLGDKFSALETYVNDLVGQRDAARNESIEGRKTLKAKVAQLEAANATLLEKLGLESVEDIDALPDMKGQAEAAKQFEAKLKKLERQLAEKDDALSAANKRFRDSALEAQLTKAVGKHEFVDADLVVEFLKNRIEWEEDSPLYKSEDGKLLPLEEGAVLLAKTKPHLLKAQGARGSGYRPDANGGESAKNPWKKETFNLTEQVRIKSENPQLAEQLKSAASA